MLAALGLVYGVLDVLMVVVAVKLVGLGAGGVGILNAAWGAGGLVGGFAALTLLGRGRFSTAAAGGAVLIGVPLAAIALAGRSRRGDRGLRVPRRRLRRRGHGRQTLVQRLASDETLARAFAVAETGNAIAVALGSVLAPLLIALFGIRGALVAVAVARTRRRRRAAMRALRRLDASAVVPERELQALRALDLFAPLPLATVETLALRAVPRVVLADERGRARGRRRRPLLRHRRRPRRGAGGRDGARRGARRVLRRDRAAARRAADRDRRRGRATACCTRCRARTSCAP